MSRRATSGGRSVGAGCGKQSRISQARGCGSRPCNSREVHSDPELCRAGPGPQCSSGSGWRKETESEAEKTKQKEATQALPAWCGCSAMISACGQRATSLFNTNFFRLIDVVPAEPPG